MARNLVRRRARGQALVETALGLIVVVTVLIFAIHFAEAGYISLKVTEAAHSAMLDATGHQLHEWPNDASPATAAATQAGQSAAARYSDFDSRTASTGSGTLTQAFTRATGMNVRCQAGGGPSWGPSIFTGLAYSDNGGISCQAEADITAINIPTDFLEDANRGFFKRRHYQATPLHVCAIGRASGGGCPAQLTSMLDDWGLSGAREGGICPLIPDLPFPCPTNRPYWEMAASVHLTTGLGLGFAGSSLAQGIVGAMPFPFFFGAENAFWMSSAGEPLFVQPLPSEGFNFWPTTPGAVPGGLGGIPYSFAYVQRRDCFLGKRCPP